MLLRMAETINRALQLLNMLQAHRHWTGTELSRRLGVTERTVRRDIDRLRELGYRIESTPGVAGGYRLEAGSAVPPLLLTDEEAVTMAIGLRVAATQRLVHGPETTLTALAKLEQVLPAALRRRVNALAAVVQPVGIGSAPTVSPDILGELALACRDHERLRFTYTSAADETTSRRVEPHALSPAERNWYLLCWDLDREDWRTFRVDRLDGVQHTRVLFEPRPLTAEQTEELFRVAAAWVRQPVETDLVMDLPYDAMREYFGEWGQGATPETDTRTRWPVGGADFRETMYGMSWIPAGVRYTTDLAEPARGELRESLTRMLAALDSPPPPPRSSPRDS